MIVNELRMAELVPYKTTLMAFINCILVATENLDDRIRIRNEFIGTDSKSSLTGPYSKLKNKSVL